MTNHLLTTSIFNINSNMAGHCLPQANHLAKAILDSFQGLYSKLQGRRVWLACSGGRDSLALADMLIRLYHVGKLPFLPQLLHVNHGLQSANSDWANQVQHWANQQGVPCYVLSACVMGTDEQSARQARYLSMLQQMNQEDVLILAHHANDQAETVLMRLLQGAGVNGLSAMQAWQKKLLPQTSSQHKKQVYLWRPWLSVSRTDITDYAIGQNLPYIDDPTNFTGDNMRGWLRQEIMPILAHQNPQVVANINRSALLLQDAYSIITEQTQTHLQQIIDPHLTLANLQNVLSIDKLVQLSEPYQRQLLHSWLQDDEPLPPNKRLVDDVQQLIMRTDNNHQTQLIWQTPQQTYQICRYRNHLYRLTKTWLAWLDKPVVNQTLTLPINQQALQSQTTQPQSIQSIAFKDPQCPYPSQNKAGLTMGNLTEVICQLNLYPSALMKLMASIELIQQQLNINPKFNHITIQLSPLARQQAIGLFSKPNALPLSGKKLLQSLAIPTWLRNSLAILSINDTAVLLCSPLQIWVLNSAYAQCMTEMITTQTLQLETIIF